MQNSQKPWGRLIRGLGANAFGQVVTAGIQIVSVPVFLKYWGVHQYGDWLILVAIPSYLALSDLGFGNVAVNEMTLLVSRGNYAAALSIFQSTWILICVISIFITAASSAIVFVPIEKWLNLSETQHWDAVVILGLMILHLLVGQQRILITGGFRCEGNYPQGILYENLLRLVEFAIVSVGVVLGATPVIAAMTFLAIRLGGTLLIWLNLHQKSPWLKYGYQQADIKTIRELFIPASAYMGFPLGEALSIQGMTIIIGAALGAGAVVKFSTLRTLSRIAWQLLRTINYSVWPELSIAFGQQNFELARKLHRYSCKAAVWLTLISLIGLAFLGRPLVTIWTAGQIQFDPVLFDIMLIVIFTNSLWSTSQMVPLAINQHQGIAFFFALGSCLSLVLAILLIPYWNLNGAALSLLLIDIFMIVVVFKKSFILLKENPKTFLFELLKPPFIKHFRRN
jgi:O-antigen/teichoic acid export membrane protein